MTTDNFNYGKAEEEYGWFEYDKAIGKMAFEEEAGFLKKYKKEILDAPRMTENKK